MNINSVHGFIPSKIQSLTISSDDCAKYGITIEDFNNADKNKDYLIDANEFLSGGINELSIFNAFKTIAASMGAFTEETTNNNQSAQVNNTDKNKRFGPNHPNISNPFTAQKHDYLA